MRKFFSFLFLMFLSAAVHAESMNDLLKDVSGISDADHREALATNRLSLFNAYARAVMDTERLRIGREAFLQAIARKDQSFGVFLPYVSLQGAYILPGTIKSTSVPLAGGSATGLSLYFRQNILTGLSSLGDYQSARSVEKISLMQTRHDAGLLLLDLAGVYYNALIMERDIRNNNEMLRLYSRMRDELRRRVALGRSRSSDLLRTDTQICQLEAQIKSMENQYDTFRRSLATLTGMTGDFVMDDSHVLDDISDAGGRIEEMVSRRWDVRSAEESLERSRIDLRTAWGGHMPTVFVQGAYTLERRYPGTDYYAGIGAELPLFSGGQVTARINEARSLSRAAELILDNTKRLARQDIMNAMSSYRMSVDETAAFKKAYDSARNNYSAVSLDYSRDRVTILDLLTSLTTLQSARNDYENSMLKQRLNRVWLGVATCELRDDGIHKLKKMKVQGQGEK
jgi:outer membrane protein